MSPISIDVGSSSFRPWSYEIEGMVKIEPLEGVEEKVLSNLGWTNLDFLNNKHVRTYHHSRGVEQSQIQMYYEFGIFSTIYGRKEMPDWISWSISSQKTPFSFTIPSSPKKQLRGLNFCYVQRRKWYEKYSPHLIETFGYPVDRLSELPTIEISNVTKNHTWRYKHCSDRIDVGGEWLTYLSHWMFGMNEMEPGDQVIITIREYGQHDQLNTKNCGVSFVYEDGSMEHALEYYKSWNHIIGGDLSFFVTTTGEYILYHGGFTRKFIKFPPPRFFGYTSKYKEKSAPSFRAFSKRKSPI
uniref:uncharacterized protein LOC122580814 n=1 Tax=Erigeron canadensis TaxID=72917 RepID=UPI001CB88AE5|nr:uncharacterized protein LOC122580814 [Erigeron canadensis]